MTQSQIALVDLRSAAIACGMWRYAPLMFVSRRTTTLRRAAACVAPHHVDSLSSGVQTLQVLNFFLKYKKCEIIISIGREKQVIIGYQ